MSLEEILLEKYYCNEDDIAQAKGIQESHGGDIGTILVNLGVISDEIFIESLSQQLGYDRLSSYEKGSLEPINLKEFPQNFLIENGIFPLIDRDEKLFFATYKDIDYSIESILNQKIFDFTTILATQDELRDVKLFFEEKEEESIDIFEDEVDKLKELASEAPVITLVNTILTKASNLNASDIHFEAYKSGIKVRIRVDGALQNIENISLSLKQAVIARLKLMSKMNIAENRLPQDGRISHKVSGTLLDIRASSVPTALGESFVLRLLGNESVVLELDKMGFHKDNLTLLKNLLKKPNGILLTTGPTGSGKTSTLYACLNYIYDEEIKIITVEDPVEYQLDGISQIQVKPSINYNFSDALRSILRQDPDVIMIGEIRDSQTAQIAIQSSLTGHFVVSTLHTNTAIGAITRLLDMGMEYYLLKSTIVGLMAQRLAKKLCNECKEKIELSYELKREYKMDELFKYLSKPATTYKSVGCEKCNFTGYKGRVPIFEIIPFNDKVKKALDNDKSFSDIRSLGYRTLQDDAILKFLEGEIAFDEVVRLTYE